jgi:predicted extracellular nuclease/2',3'-cyclic-nucleotide 2'-phosphodiesterase (5'-nucleotidase family)
MAPRDMLSEYEFDETDIAPALSSSVASLSFETTAHFTLQLFHAADQEAGIDAILDAPRFSAVLNALRLQDVGADATLTLSSGDAYIPGVFASASELIYGATFRGDILIQNALGFEAIAFGNHEFDLGTNAVRSVILPASFEGFAYPGTAFPYLSVNLDFAADSAFNGLVRPNGGAPEAQSVTGSVVFERGGELIGVIGAVTPTLGAISSPGTVGVFPQPFGSPASDAELDALAAIIQAEVDALKADNAGLNKVILLAHMQQIAVELALAERLAGVDIIVAGGSNTRLFDENDIPRDGDSVQGDYPALRTGADGDPVLVVNTDGNYKYVGRLVIGFDEEGVILVDTYDPAVSGAYATDADGLARVLPDGMTAEDLTDPTVQAVADAVGGLIASLDSHVFGYTDVFLEGRRTEVRSQETNFGNLTADANLWYARSVDDSVVVSIKNGGGIRNAIGEIVVPTGGTDAPEFLPPAENPLSGRAEGGISQLAIQDTLRFNNGLTLLTVTRAQLVDVLERGVAGAAPGATPGNFAQVSGVRYSFDFTQPNGSRIVNAAIVDDEGNVIEPLVRDGEIIGDPATTFRIVTLNFLAGGGDGYPFPQGAEAERLDLTQPADAPRTGGAVFAADGSEQDVLAEYLLTFHATPETAFSAPDTPASGDLRVQNLAFADDTVFAGFDFGDDGEPPLPGGLIISEIVEGSGNNKAVELTNFTGETIDLGAEGYQIRYYFNGSEVPGRTISLTGLIEDGEAFVLGNGSAVQAVLDVSDQIDNSTQWFNGDDVIALVRVQDGDVTFVDVFGQIGARANWNQDVTLRRKDGIVTGDANPSDAFDPAAQWVSLPQNTFDGLGQPSLRDPVDPEPEPEPEPELITIMEIQGAGHVSSLVGERVTTSGIVTAVAGNGFYMQDPDGDGDIATSDAIFVFQGSNPSFRPAVGDAVVVEGTVSEFTPGGVATRNLSQTQLGGAPVIAVVSSGNALPAAVVLGADGRLPPTGLIDDDAFAIFDPVNDAIDFFESLEGMLVTVSTPRAVSATNGFGEVFTVVDAGAGIDRFSDRGALAISPENYNPEKVQLQFGSGNPLNDIETPLVPVGAIFADVTGIMSYAFGNFEVLVTEPAEVVFTPELTETVTTITGSADRLTIASYNVLNLDPNDADSDMDVALGRFETLARHIAENLGAPDILALQEVQDNSGSANDGFIAADMTLQMLVDAIAAAGGPTYAFIDNPYIVDGRSGGEPGGNIRNAFLYNPERVTFDEASLRTIGAQQPGQPFDGTRLPLIADFGFNGETVTVVNNHFSSKGGSAAIVGTEQPFELRQDDPSVNGGVDARLAQAQAVKDFVDALKANDPSAMVAVVGDFNEFEFNAPLQLLGESLANLVETLPQEERYSFVFQGNAQTLDHLLVSSSLAADAQFEFVRVNIEFPEVPELGSDHDPLIASLYIPARDPGFNVIAGTDGNDRLTGTDAADQFIFGKGNDAVTGGAGGDLFDFSLALADGVRNVKQVLDYNPSQGDAIRLGGVEILSVRESAAGVTLVAGEDRDQIVLRGVTKFDQIIFDELLLG